VSKLDDKSRQVLELLVEHNIPLPARVIYGALIHNGDADASERTYTTRIRKLRDGGYIRRVQVDPVEMEIVDLDRDSGHGYYLPTDAGREALA